ncbi:MAG: ATP-binding cassette domain-containing protein [Chloroflexota bacterium]|nr:ATP-binding cassette domain-containing protein [Chloroflexota bacterium]
MERSEGRARAVGAHEFITKLPEGYDTAVSERGQNLSVGQRQLISFARALLADPRILVLDEATANIDSYSESLIQQALTKVFKGRTSFVIAHRLSTIRNADRIVVLGHGQVLEQGTHDSLMGQGGAYAGLYSAYFAAGTGAQEAGG